jgi:hypothetical protein
MKLFDAAIITPITSGIGEIPTASAVAIAMGVSTSTAAAEEEDGGGEHAGDRRARHPRDLVHGAAHERSHRLDIRPRAHVPLPIISRPS